ncbi:protein Shroom3 [Danio aesculapii]|uniref:protein Shroom3 n=1 Tax=Danio aesculapii TaxID=1142201 RepID=UPI0024BFA485|nr:protein Shroom3 [Danio aesculapii]
MDSYNFHFERMSNLDLHPLSLPVSRLSPAKSSSSIDQYTHHHHSKGDSAYSSFSGGSTVPDYPSPFLLDELQSQSLHYNDLKQVKAKYSPTALDSDSKSMDQLYRSMEIVPQPHWSSSGFPKIEDPPHPLLPPPPPPPPARLNSFVATRNLENLRTRQSPEGQHADISTLQQASGPEVCSVQADTLSQLNDHLDHGDKTLDAPNHTGILHRSSLQSCQPDPLQHSWSGHSETQRKRSHSAYCAPVSEHQSSCNMPQNMISGSIQHKGQFYFVTGVFKSSEPSIEQDDGADLETSTEWSYKAQRRRQSCPDGPSGKLFFQEEHQFSIQNEDVEHLNNKADFRSEQTCESVEDQKAMSRETGRHHSTSHPIFYCGPEDSSAGVMMTPAQIKEDLPKIEDRLARVSRWPQVDIPSDKISKETTPLLYHLTGANRASKQFKNNNDTGVELKNPECFKDEPKTVYDGQTSPSSEKSKEEQPNEFFYQCATLDDSYKKYYKEKLKDVQSKVLRETSFKRRDLQLSLSHRVKQWTDKKLSVIPSSPSTLDLRPNLDIHPTPHKPQETDRENTGQEIEKETVKPKKPQNIAQPQVPRVGSRKRLTADQKKLSHSEPEKLHQLADGPSHTTCRSLGNESEGLLSEADHGLVASRRKMFETRGRAMSASNFSKSSLKHLQHKALVAYMERKTGQKVAEPQHPVPQEPSHRDSTVERQSEWSPQHNSGSKKLHRPLSAGQILDSVSSSVKYSQFITAQSSVHSRQSSWREETPATGKSASVESLLDQPEQPKLPRSRSTSIPHAFQIHKHPDEFSAINNKAVSSVQRKVEGRAVRQSYPASVPDERRFQVRASRGKSMEELGASAVTKPAVLSKSSEQLDQHLGQRRTVSFLAEGRRAQKTIHSSTENIQAAPENPCLTCTIKHESSNDDELHVVSHTTHKHVDDSIVSVPSPLSKHGGIKLEVSKEQEHFPQDETEASLVSNEEVSLSHGVTTDPSLWISTIEINEEEPKICLSSETTTFVEPQNPPPALSAENHEPTSIPHHAEIQESVQDPADDVKNDEDDPKNETEGNTLEWEVLVQEVVSADESLARTFFPVANRKTALMLMEQLLSEDTLLMEEHYKKKHQQMLHNPEKDTHCSEMLVGDNRLNHSSSVDKQSAIKNQKDEHCNMDMDIVSKKKQLMAHIKHQLKSLEDVRSAVQAEEKVNGARGEAVQALVGLCCVPAELERYSQFIGDLERVLSLLLCLSARLARVQNALSTVDDSVDAEEKQSLDSRYRLLCKQRDDAKDLKDNLDRRERLVSGFLCKQLKDTQMQEYRRFIQTKASLLIRLKDLDEKQRLGEEQLEALLCSLPP